MSRRICWVERELWKVRYGWSRHNRDICEFTSDTGFLEISPSADGPGISPKCRGNPRAGHECTHGWPGSVPTGIWAPNLAPRSVKILSHGSPGAVSQKPMGQRVPAGISNDGSSRVLTGIPVGTHSEKWKNQYILHCKLPYNIRRTQNIAQP